MKFKFKTIIITTLILFSITTITIANTSFFMDVKEDVWYTKHIKSVVDKGYMNGYPDNTFRPNDFVTRAELAKVIDTITTPQSTVTNFDSHIVNLVTKITPSVVQIRKFINGVESGGTGFIIKKTDSKTINILTNYHIIEHADRLDIYLSNGKMYQGKVVMTNPSIDLALITIEEEQELKHLEFTTIVQSGQSVIVIGHPYANYTNTVTKGIVSHTSRKWEIQIDAAINMGNSGSPILDVKGKILGIATSKIQDADNIGFGVRSEVIIEFLEGKSKVYY